MEYWEMSDFVRESKVVSNRVGVCNEILGCKYHHANDNPLTLVYSHGRYEVRYLGDLICSYRVWHLDEVRNASRIVDDWSRCLLLLRRGGQLLALV